MPSAIIECCLGNDGGETPKEIYAAAVKIFSDQRGDARVKSKGPKIANKQFVARESVLTELFKTKHGAVFYRICIIFSLFSLLSSVIVDIADNAPIDIGQHVIWRNWQDVPMTILIWLVMVVFVLTSYFSLCIWASQRNKVSRQSRWLYDLFFGTEIVVLDISFLIVPSLLTILYDIGPICTISVAMELVRFATKGCSCMRVCISRVVQQRGGMPGFGHFLYFIACPTGIYRDEYPRTDKRSGIAIVTNCLELLWCGVMTTFIISRMHHPGFYQFRSIWLDAWPLLASFIATIVPSGVVFILIFYGYFHCYFNIQAELTGFADRLFYKDWWTVKTYGEYFRTWNTIFQDWLFVHVYRDVRKFTDNRFLANIAVFFVSGIAHEFVFSVILKFFYPVMSVAFGMVGFTLAIVPSFSLGNTGVWITFPIGCGIIITSYLSEYFSRINCPYTDGGPTIADFFIPRSWTCPLT